MAAVNAKKCAYASAGITAPTFATPPKAYIFREIVFSYVL
jgi:hypothetical protein